MKFTSLWIYIIPITKSVIAQVQEMNPESTPMGSIEDINPIRQQESETKPSASSYVSKSSFHQKLPCGDLVGMFLIILYNGFILAAYIVIRQLFFTLLCQLFYRK